MTRIVILGGGFAGVACALELARSKAHRDLSITLVDERPYHLYHPLLYEVVSAARGLSAEELRNAATIPHEAIFSGTGVAVRRAHVKYWNEQEQCINLESGILAYDVLVIALGSTSEYFGVPGAQEYAWPFKSFDDAVRFRNAFQSEFRRPDGVVTAVVSGGGFTGVECAAELAGLVRHLGAEGKRIGHVVVVEGCPQLLPGLDPRVAVRVRARLEHLGVELRLNTLVERVSKDGVALNSNERIKTKFVLWTSGVRACPLPGVTKDVCGVKGRLSTDRMLRVAGHTNVYTVGDIACTVGADGKPLPQTASLAIQEGQYVARAVVASIEKKKMDPFRAHFEGYVIPVGGKHALFVHPSGWIVGGRLGWGLRRLVDLMYLCSVLPFARACSIWMRANRLLVKND